MLDNIIANNLTTALTDFSRRLGEIYIKKTNGQTIAERQIKAIESQDDTLQELTNEIKLLRETIELQNQLLSQRWNAQKGSKSSNNETTQQGYPYTKKSSKEYR